MQMAAKQEVALWEKYRSDFNLFLTINDELDKTEQAD